MIVKRLSELSRSDLATAGGKGANLGEMVQLGLPVPPGFVVSAAAYAEQARQWGLAGRLEGPLAAGDWEAASAAASALFGSGALLPEIESAIREAHRHLGAARVAVRSSATAEDLAEASFAGQHETYLDVAGEDAVLAATRRCWASLFHPRALHYRHARGIPHLEVAIAVVVQQMVPAAAAGVLFTVDPVAQRSDRMLLSAAPGLGEALVSGLRRGDTYRLRREPYGEGREGPPARPGEGDPAIVDRELESPGQPALSDPQILEVCRLGLALEAHFGNPQDIEFAVASDRVFFLQSRPITTLGTVDLERIEPLGELDYLQRKGLAQNFDRFPLAPKPLDHWMIKGARGALAHMVRHIGFSLSEADERAASAGLWHEAFVMPRMRPSLRLLGMPVRAVQSLRRDWSGWWSGEPMDRLRAVSRPVDLTAMTDAELVSLADQAITVMGQVLGKRFESMLGMTGISALNLGVLTAVGKKRAAAVLADLLGGLHTKTSETNRALFLLAQQAIAAGPEVADAVRSGRVEGLAVTPAGRAYLAAFNAFLDEYGHREGACLYLSAPTWKHDPEPVWGIVRGFMQISELPGARGAERYRAALEEVEGRLGAVPGVQGAFRSLLDRVRSLIVFRENTHFDLTRPVHAAQSAVLEIGRRLHERGLLSQPADVFYLTEAEVKAWLGGEPPAKVEVAKLLKRRRATYQVANGRWQKRRFSGAAPGGEPGSGAAGAGVELRGAGASAGVVQAKARIVRGEHQLDRLKPGEILVCSYTNPSWTPLFAYAAGVVTDTGGAGSHAAIVAREYGIPAVMGVSGATERISDGQELLVDGTEGRVRLLSPTPGRSG
jgi:phosphohistidine swiveling domain-containing protein